MFDFDHAFEIVVGVEGGFGMDKNDPGNWTHGKIGQGQLNGTKYGISAAAYPDLDIKGLALEKAKMIYYSDYWMAAHCDEMKWPLSLVVFDCAVNQGTGAAIKHLQSALGVSSDGQFGPGSRNALKAKDASEAAVALLRVRAESYRKMRQFDLYGAGWMNRLFRVALAA